MNILRSICGGASRKSKNISQLAGTEGNYVSTSASGNSASLKAEREKMDTVVEKNVEYVEGVVCSVKDLNDNEMKVFPLGSEGDKVLIVKENGIISALGHKCPHYGAPLENGVLSEGRIRCQWHGACFNASTGDIEDFPGLDNLPCFQVNISDEGNINVKAEKQSLKSQRRIVQRILQYKSSPVFLVIGGGASGVTCVETLRSEGFDGAITFVLGNEHLPYDRPKLSKNLNASINDIILRKEDYYQERNIQIIRNQQLAQLDADQKVVHLSGGLEIRYDKLFLATGASPRRIPAPGSNLENILVLRSVDDASIISAAVSPTSNVVILGSSFIGLEAAASLVDKVQSINVVAIENIPFDRILGNDVGLRIKELFEVTRSLAR